MRSSCAPICLPPPPPYPLPPRRYPSPHRSACRPPPLIPYPLAATPRRTDLLAAPPPLTPTPSPLPLAAPICLPSQKVRSAGPSHASWMPGDTREIHGRCRGDIESSSISTPNPNPNPNPTPTPNLDARVVLEHLDHLVRVRVRARIRARARVRVRVRARVSGEHLEHLGVLVVVGLVAVGLGHERAW